MTGSSVTVVDGEVFFDGTRPSWPIVKVRDVGRERGWPHVGFVVATGNGWRVNVTLRQDDGGLPEEGTSGAPRVMIAPFDMDEVVAVGPLIASMHFRLETRVVEAATLPALFDEVAARPSPPPEIVAALATYRAPTVARSKAHLLPPPEPPVVTPAPATEA